MTPYLRQRLEALQVVETSEALAESRSEVRLDSRANSSQGQSRGARMAKARKVMAQRSLGAALAVPFYRFVQTTDESVDFFVVRLTRYGPRVVDPDNLEAAFKAVQDGIARKLRIDDGDAFVRYVCDQQQGPYAVRASLFARWK